MLKVLICDDEMSICRLIVRLIRWEELGLTLIGTAHNGRDALELIVNKVPDIVLTDIRMPIYSGIELAGKAKQLGINARFIVISGYDNFVYARDALKASVSDYLLKPINARELNDTLRRVVERIRRDREQRSKVDSMENLLQHMSSLERDIFMKNVILGNAAAYSPSMLKACGLDFSRNCYSTFTVAFDTPEDGSAGQRNILEQMVDKLCQSLLTEDYPCMSELLLSHSACRIYGVFNYQDVQNAVVSNYLGDIYYACRRLCPMLPELHVTLAVGADVRTPAELSASMQTSSYALHCRANLGTDRIIFYSDLPESLCHRPRMDNAAVSRLRSCLDLCDEEALGTVIKSLFNEDRPGGSVSWYQLANELLDFIRKEVSDAHPSGAETEDWRTLYDNTCSALESAWTPEQLCTALLNYCKAVMEPKSRPSAPQSEQAIELAKKYIAENYAGECSLRDVASYAHLSPNYLSSVFKKKVGMSMNSYIAVVRINEAKLLLKNTAEGIYDIGERVGYKDPKHFRKVFKENVGISPAKYRSLYQ